MKQITCPFCGDTYPDFDVAHVCSKGPYAIKLKPKMNERLKELYKQSQIGPGLGYDMDKFAELIVRECAKWMSDGNIPDGFYEAGRMLEHFGVEE